MSIERGKGDGNYRRSRAGLGLAVFVLAAALLFVLAHGTHWPIAMHGLVVITLSGVVMLLFFNARGRRSDGISNGGGTTISGSSDHAS